MSGRKSEKTTEDYLEAILIIREEKGYARAVDLAHFLKITPPSVSYTTKRLKEHGLVTSDDAGMLLLTDNGMKIAEKIYERHVVLTKMLTGIGVSQKTASQDACRMEHDISDEIFRCIRSHIGNL